MKRVEIVESTCDRLKIAFEKSSLKQADLVKVTGIDKSSISLYLSGKVTPKGDKLYKLALALNVSPVWLSGFDVPMQEDKKTEPAAENGNKLSESQKKLIKFVESVPEDKVDLVLKVMRSIVEDD